MVFFWYSDTLNPVKPLRLFSHLLWAVQFGCPGYWILWSREWWRCQSGIWWFWWISLKFFWLTPRTTVVVCKLMSIHFIERQTCWKRMDKVVPRPYFINKNSPEQRHPRHLTIHKFSLKQSRFKLHQKFTDPKKDVDHCWSLESRCTVLLVYQRSHWWAI